MKKLLILIILLSPLFLKAQVTAQWETESRAKIDTLSLGVTPSKGVTYWEIQVDMADSTKGEPDTTYSVKDNRAFMAVKTNFQNSIKEWWTSTVNYENNGKEWSLCGMSLQKEYELSIFTGLSTGSIQIGGGYVTVHDAHLLTTAHKKKVKPTKK